MASDKNFGKGLVIGLLTGGALGAAIALLFAPKSGKELRADIKEKAGNALDEAERYYDVAKEKAISTINEGKKKSEQIIHDAKTKSEVILSEAQKILNDAKGAAVKEGDRLKDAVKAGIDTYKESKNS